MFEPKIVSTPRDTKALLQNQSPSIHQTELGKMLPACTAVERICPNRKVKSSS